MVCGLLSIFSGLKVTPVTCGTSYKFALLYQSIVRSSLDIGHTPFLKNPIFIIPMGLEIGLRGLPQDTITDLGDPKLCIYKRFNI